METITQFQVGDAVRDHNWSWKGGTVCQVTDDDKLLVGVWRADRATMRDTVNGGTSYKRVARYLLVDPAKTDLVAKPSAAPTLSPSDCLALFNRAEAAGKVAGDGARPTPMVVGTPKNMMASLTGGDDGGLDPNQPTYYVSDGACGFAWVVVKPGTSSFARWLVKTDRGHSHYGGGIALWVHEYGQSMDRKSAYAAAFARVLAEAGINAYSDSRMD